MITYGYKAILYKETKQMSRDHFTIIFSAIVPIIQLLIFGYAINFTVKDVPMVVCDLDKHKESRVLVQRLENSTLFQTKAYVESQEAMYDAIKKGDAKVGVLIPKDYSARLMTKTSPKILVLIDGSDSTIGPQAASAITSIGLQGSLETIAGDVSKSGGFLDVSTKMLFNPDSKTSNYMIPGLIAVILQLTTVILTALSIVKEKDSGTLNQLLVAPIKPIELILAKITPYSIIGIIQVLLVNFAMVAIFDVPFNGNFGLLLVLSFQFIITTLALGLLISIVAQNFMQALLMSIGMLLPSILLSGFVAPRESMPDVLYWLSFLFPATYFIDIMRSVVLRAADFGDMLFNFMVLFGMFLVFVGISIKKFKSLYA